MEKAYQEYDIFNKTQLIEFDFNKIVKGLEKKFNFFSGLWDYDTITEKVFLESDKSELTELKERDTSCLNDKRLKR